VHKTRIIYGTFTVDQVLPHIGTKVKGLLTPTFSHGVHTANCFSDRLRLFKEKGTTCVTCGAEATHFLMETFNEKTRPHLNLYKIVDGEQDLLFTKDHIHPLSKGGADELYNLQTMCRLCNLAKGNTWEE